MNRKCAICGYDCVNEHHPFDYFEEYDPHEVSKVKCDLCGFEWIAVRPEGLTRLECKQCGNMVHFENIG